MQKERIIWNVNTICRIFAADKETVQGNGIVPFFFSQNCRIRMILDTKQKAIEDLVNARLSDGEDVFLVEVKVIPGNNIKVFLDADNGITIEKCIKVNRALYKQIEESDLFANGDFSLEVSSPGVEEPLRLHRQYKKNIGRNVEIIMNDGTKKEGKLAAVNDDEIIIEEKTGQGKKTVSKTTNILFNQVKHTKVLVTF